MGTTRDRVLASPRAQASGREPWRDCCHPGPHKRARSQQEGGRDKREKKQGVCEGTEDACCFGPPTPGSQEPKCPLGPTPALLVLWSGGGGCFHPGLHEKDVRASKSIPVQSRELRWR